MFELPPPRDMLNVSSNEGIQSHLVGMKYIYMYIFHIGQQHTQKVDDFCCRKVDSVEKSEFDKQVYWYIFSKDTPLKNQQYNHPGKYQDIQYLFDYQANPTNIFQFYVMVKATKLSNKIDLVPWF